MSTTYDRLRAAAGEAEWAAREKYSGEADLEEDMKLVHQLRADADRLYQIEQALRRKASGEGMDLTIIADLIRGES